MNCSGGEPEGKKDGLILGRTGRKKNDYSTRKTRRREKWIALGENRNGEGRIAPGDARDIFFRGKIMKGEGLIARGVIEIGEGQIAPGGDKRIVSVVSVESRKGAKTDCSRGRT